MKSTIPSFDEFINEEVSSNELKSLLWNKSWKDFFNTNSTIYKILDKFRSISSMSADISIDDIKNVEKTLSKANIALASALKELEKFNK